jgi:hypothetical protein
MGVPDVPYLGIAGERAGSLLGPTVMLNAVVTILLARAWQKEQRTRMFRN